MLVKVKEGCKGFYYGERRRSGDVFDLKEGDAFSERWMIKVEPEKPIKAEKPAEVEKPKSRGRPKKVKSETDETENDS